jgi:tetratricopeptide (TPR) repeat protein
VGFEEVVVMRLSAFVVSCVLVIGGTSRGLAQQPTGPATLEGLLNSDEGQKPAATAADADPKPPAGTVARPKDGVKHPDLDKAWADYDTVVAKAAESIKAAISKQFDAAAGKGDLDAAEKWQAALEKFEKAGEVPAEAETKAAVSAAVADYKKAKEELGRAYESVVKALTTEKKIAEAKDVRDEILRLTPKEFGKQQAKAAGRTLLQETARHFVGRWRNQFGQIVEIRDDGTVIVKGDSRDPWSGKWHLDVNDPNRPCAVRNANNKTVTRWYKDGANLVDQNRHILRRDP